MNSVLAPWQHQFIETNHIRLHYVTQGEGELVVLLHGFAEFWYSWRYQLPELARHFKVVVPDLRGYNDSDKPQGGYDLTTLGTDILGLIHNLGYRQAHVVGHDCGGMIVWHLAQHYPDALKGIALLNAPHPQHLVQDLIGNWDQMRRNWPLLAMQVPGVPEWLIRQNLQQFLREWFQSQAIRKAAFSSETLRIYRAALEKTGVVTSALNSYRQLFSAGQWLSRLGRLPQPIQVPALVLWGEEDSLLSPQSQATLEQLIKAPFRFKAIPECGHWIQQEVPRLVNRELLSFLRGFENSDLQTLDS
ncbi:alpha/beta fold hydrolase [Synechococcales cyanobacterium C]|uniref:Alpha/beta fold hydrolase n=1 Tax=Petrachloros mirabilis ULC683 TaxID=2781853 RepID=A0A8K2A136_9CYAN|nr:alpha/beta hydrolase [Petrachloros mirabilis]NCJ07858.1 alpha/beta fold hydrolase [Petrachloros mirabilis ULC683]